MKTTDAYPALGPEYDDEPVALPSRRVVYAILGVLAVAVLLTSAFLYEAGHTAFGLVSPYL